MPIYKKIFESKEVANKNILRIKRRGGVIIEKEIKGGKFQLKYLISSKNIIIENMLKDKHTIELMKDLGDEEHVKSWIKNYHSNPKNHNPNIYYRVEGGGAGQAGVGKGMYLGQDKNALINFYDIEEKGLPVSEYQGKPKWLDLRPYAKHRDFAKKLLAKGIEIENSDKVGQIVMNMGYDGIVYYDPWATGEEFVLFNTKAVRKVK